MVLAAVAAVEAESDGRAKEKPVDPPNGEAVDAAVLLAVLTAAGVVLATAVVVLAAVAGKAKEKPVEPPNAEVEVVPLLAAPATSATLAAGAPPKTDGAGAAVAAAWPPPNSDVAVLAGAPPNALVVEGALPKSDCELLGVLAAMEAAAGAGTAGKDDVVVGAPPLTAGRAPNSEDWPNTDVVAAPLLEAVVLVVPPNRDVAAAARLALVVLEGCPCCGAESNEVADVTGFVDEEATEELTGELAAVEGVADAGAGVEEAARFDAKDAKLNGVELGTGVLEADPKRGDGFPKIEVAAVVTVGDTVEPKMDVPLPLGPPKMLPPGLLAAAKSDEDVVVLSATAATLDADPVVEPTGSEATGVMVTLLPSMVWMDDTLGVGRSPSPGLEDGAAPTTMRGVELGAGAEAVGAEVGGETVVAGFKTVVNEKEEAPVELG